MAFKLFSKRWNANRGITHDQESLDNGNNAKKKSRGRRVRSHLSMTSLEEKGSRVGGAIGDALRRLSEPRTAADLAIIVDSLCFMCSLAADGGGGAGAEEGSGGRRRRRQKRRG